MTQQQSKLILFSSLLLAAVACAQMPGDNGQAASTDGVQELRSPHVDLADHHDVSPPLMLMQSASNDTNPEHEVKRIPRPTLTTGNSHALYADDPVRQASLGLMLAAPTAGVNWEGQGQGLSGFSITGAPPDTNGDVGPNHYVQTVNSELIVWNKTGTILYGPVNINTLWSGFGGNCQADNDGDPIVLYDRAADRWFISQFAVTNPGSNYLQCVAVSQTSDPTGAYYRYSFPYGTGFNDYGKAGVWSDAYYFTYNMFTNGSTFAGAKACAMNRSAMLTGATATQQCFNTSTSYGGILPADIDGPTQPPAGEPEWIVGLGTSSTTLAYWKFHVDWTTPANSTFTGPTSVTVASYTEACSGGTCIPQSGTTQQLDSLADRMMYRLQYINHGGVESLVTNHSVTAGSSTGVRWYELRVSGGTSLSLYQQGTFAPDSLYRWMGSAAMNKSGDIGLGYSISSSSSYPSIRYTGRLGTDATGTMTQGEAVLQNGGGNQGTTLSRWGDYSMLALDPSDDCTFWYTQEYIATTGTFNWHTRVGSFKLSTCGGGGGGDTTPPTTSITAPTNGATVSGTVNITTSSSDNVGVTKTEIYVDGALKATAASYAWDTTTATNTSHTIYSKAYDAAGNVGQSSTVTVTVSNSTGGGSGITNGGFESGLSGWTTAGTASSVSGGHSGSYAAQVGSTTQTNGDSSVSQTFTAPSTGGSLTFWYKVVCPDSVTYDWATATLKDNTAGTTATVLAKTCTNSGSWVQSTAATLTASHSYTLTLTSHDDNYAGDATYTLYDDVVIGAGGGGGGGGGANAIANGTFETGSLSSWTTAGTASAVSGGHSGTYAARVGSTAATNGDSSVTQTFTAATGDTSLSFWYKVVCPDSVTYDWATVTLKDNTAGTTTTVLAKTCTNTGSWVQKTQAITAGHSYTLTLTSHDDNYASDPTYTLYDDVSTQ